MEPEEQKQKDETKKEIEDLHAEGVDIVGSGMALDNEYNQPEVHKSNTEENTEAESEPEVKPEPSFTPTPAVEPVPEAKTESSTEVPNVQTPKQPEIAETDPVKNDPSIKPIRTFKTDAEEAVRYGNMSKIDMVLAEQNKKETSNPIEYENETKSHPGIYVSIVLIVIALLAGGWYYWFTTSQTTKEEIPRSISIKTPIPYTKAGVVTVGEANAGRTNALELIETKMGSADLALGDVQVFVPIEHGSSTEPVSTTNLFASTHMGSRLARSLSNDYMIGMYMSSVRGPFIIIRNTFYQNAYSGMLEWEKDMRTDLMPFIRINHENESGASVKVFKDTVVSNIDVRILEGENGETILAYAFPDKDTIIIATNTNTIKYLLDRLLQVRTIQ